MVDLRTSEASFSKRTAVITGASSGIGAATALRLAGHFRGLVLHARKSQDALADVAAEVRTRGSEAVTVLGDLTDETLGTRLASAAEETWGRLDCLVANAGFPILRAFKDGSRADLEHAFKANVFSLFELARAAESLLAQSVAGRIVAVGSFTAHAFRNDIRQFPMSAASKGAVETAVRSLAMHFSNYEVTVNCVVPGFIRKPTGSEDSVSDAELDASVVHVPLRRAGKPDEVAAAISFLLSEDASYITGQSLHVNGGLV